MIDWDDTQVFLAIARTGSLSGAGRALRVNHATVLRRLDRLEASLGGRRLFERGARGYRLTAAGESALASARAMEEAAHDLHRSVERSPELRGAVRVSALPSFAAWVLAPALATRIEDEPGIMVELVGEERNSALSRGEADIAVRHGQPASGDERIRRLPDVEYRLYGSEAYLGRTIASERRVLGFTEAQQQGTAIGRKLAELTSTLGPPLRASSMPAQAAAAEAGAGLAFLPRHVAARHPALQPASDPLWRQPTWLILRQDVRDVARVRKVADWIIAALDPSTSAQPLSETKACAY